MSSGWFNPTEPPRTCSNHSTGQGTIAQEKEPNRTVIRAGSEGLNHPELLRNYLTGQVSSVKLWFEQVQKD